MFFWENPLILIFYTYIFGVSEDINNKLFNVNFDQNKLIIADNEEPFEEPNLYCLSEHETFA